MKLFLIVLLITASFTCKSNDNQIASEVGLELLATGKVTGSCSILKQQLEFQVRYKLKGGGAFLDAFWKLEAQRLNMPMFKFTKLCEQVFGKYRYLLKAFTEMKSQEVVPNEPTFRTISYTF